MKLLNYMKKILNYGELFEAKARNWEGFTIGEHTETVLRVFEDTFENSVPQDLCPFIKFIIINHDIGKGLAYYRGTNQEYENENECKRLFSKLNVSKKVQDLLLYLIIHSQYYTTSYYVKGNHLALKGLYNECQKVLKEYMGVPPSANEIRGLMSICKILQTCDSAAYTRYAITRDEKRGVYYKNGNDTFTESFDKPKDIRGRKVSFKRK